MAKLLKIILICGAVFAVLVVCCSITVRYDEEMKKTRGYGLVCLGRPAAPYDRAANVLWEVDEFCRTYLRDGPGRWPAAETLAENIPDLMLDSNQPYRLYEIYVLRTLKTKQWFLYSTETSSDFLTASDLEGAGVPSRGAMLHPVVMCVMGTHEVAPGEYRPYNEYPAALVRIIGEEAWITWVCLSANGLLTGFFQSAIPPVPGCIALEYVSKPERSKFYYPEAVLPKLRAIYPNVQVPEELILRTEGREPNEGKAGTAGDPR